MRTGEIQDFVEQHRHLLLMAHFDGHKCLPIYLLDRQRTRGDLSITWLPI